MRNSNSILRLIFSILWLALLTGCFGTGGDKVATRYYLIDPLELELLNSSSDKPLVIEIIDVHLPRYLERFHIVTRIGENRLKFSESHQWGENLRKNLMRTMSRNLSKLLSTQDIGTPLKRSSSSPDYRVQIYIERFEKDTDLKVKLRARWQISAKDISTPLGIYIQEIESSEIEDDYEQMVTAMRELYGDLSKKIAESIIIEDKK